MAEPPGKGTVCWCGDSAPCGRPFRRPLERRLSARQPREGWRTGWGICNRGANERIRRIDLCRRLTQFDLRRPEGRKRVGRLPGVTLVLSGTGFPRRVSDDPPPRPPPLRATNAL